MPDLGAAHVLGGSGRMAFGLHRGLRTRATGERDFWLDLCVSRFERLSREVVEQFAARRATQ